MTTPTGFVNGERFLSLDVNAVDIATQAYPDNLQEPVQWLASYVRNRCNKSVSTLAAHVAALGFDHSGTTFSRVLRGQWKTDAAGNPTASPIISAEKLLLVIEKLRDREAMREVKGGIGFVKTETFGLIQDHIEVRRSPDRICKWGFIYGVTGSQKSASFKQVERAIGERHCLHVESPEKPSTVKLIRSIVRKLGGSLTTGSERMVEKIYQCVNRRCVIIVDNVQRLYKPRDGWNQPAFNFLAKLQEETECVIILSATLEFAGVMESNLEAGFFEQFEGRVGGRSEFLEVPEYASPEDVLKIAAAFGLADAAQHLDYLVKVSRMPGRIRILFQRLQTAGEFAEASGEELKIEHVKLSMGDAAIEGASV